MKLLTCSKCCIVINQDAYQFDEDMWYIDDGEGLRIDPKNAEWCDGEDEWKGIIKCPVCGNKIVTDKIIP